MNEVVNKLIEFKETISVMESCTGGGVAYSITNVPGASEIFEFGAVTYSNQYKVKLGVSSELIDKYSVYSPEVAKDMARAIVKLTNSANPYGEDNTVYICILDRINNTYYPKTIVLEHEDRISNKEQIIKEVSELLLSIINKKKTD